LATGCASGWPTSLAIPATFARTSDPMFVFHKIVYLIEAGERSERSVSEIYRGVDEELLRQLDDGAICPADVSA
jgi:hypothetical protein